MIDQDEASFAQSPSAQLSHCCSQHMTIVLDQTVTIVRCGHPAAASMFKSSAETHDCHPNRKQGNDEN